MLEKAKIKHPNQKKTILQRPKSTNEHILKPNIKKFMQRNYAIKYRKPIKINQEASHRAVEA